MTSKFYKIFFFSFLILGGLLLLPAEKAGATCICEGSDWNRSTIQSQSVCQTACSPFGVKTWAALTDAPATDESNGGIDNSNQDQLPGIDGSNQGAAVQNSASLPNFLGSGVNSIKDLILKIVAFLIDLAKYFAALMLVWAGFLFVTAQGDPAKLTKARQNLLWTVVGIAVILASDAIVTYVMEVLGVTGAGAGSALLNKIKDTLTQIVALLFILVTLLFFWGIVEFVRASAGGDSKKLEDGKRHMIWGIIGMAVMAGAWGIVEMIRAFFL